MLAIEIYSSILIMIVLLFEVIFYGLNGLSLMQSIYLNYKLKRNVMSIVPKYFKVTTNAITTKTQRKYYHTLLKSVSI